MKVECSDYGSGSSTSSSSSWLNQQRWPSMGSELRDDFKSPIFMNLMMGKCTLDDVMKEFQMNGSDSPYYPDEDIWRTRPEDLAGMGPGSAYVRQKSWPAPDKSPAMRLPRPNLRPEPRHEPRIDPRVEHRAGPRPRPHSGDWLPTPIATSTPVNDATNVSTGYVEPMLTEDQARVLGSLPDALVHALLRKMQRNRASGRSTEECRFCKNNGERESYYRSHSLRDAAGRARCPVLRALVCARCGAHGDTAHTIKYCPLTTHEERMKSTAMMRSVRIASGRRRLRNIASPAVTPENYLMLNKQISMPSTGNYLRSDTTPSVVHNVSEPPLDPLWAALEQKLML